MNWKIGKICTFTIAGCLLSLTPAMALTVTESICFDDFEIVKTESGISIRIEGMGALNIPGKPKLPSRIYAFAIPPGATVKSVRVDGSNPYVLPGSHHVAPVTLRRVISGEKPEHYQRLLNEYQSNLYGVYKADRFYPARIGEFIRQSGLRRYNIADIRISPVQYNPVSGTLVIHRNIEIRIDVEFPAGQKQKPEWTDRPTAREKLAREMIWNYREAQSWYPAPETSRDGHQTVIITTEDLTGSVVPLIEWEQIKGSNPEVVTVEWIDQIYTGVDLAQKMRNFLIEKYPTEQWGIEEVLLAGHHTDVPMREAASSIGYGNPLTDFYFAELSLPDEQSWDSDQDGQYCDPQDAMDYYSEVNVGRIPWSDPDTLESICRKSVLFEQNDDPEFKKNILLLGAFFWENTDNAVLMEAKVDQTWMADWTLTRMYEKNSEIYSDYDCDYELLRANVQDIWSNGMYSFVNWAGHGSPTSSHIMGIGSPAFITGGDASLLNDDYPAIIFADACSNSDTDTTNIGMSMLKQGGVGFVGATKVAYGASGWESPDDGSSQSLDYYFTTGVTSAEYSQGAAHQRGLMLQYQNEGWYDDRYEMTEWNIWGHPSLGMAPVLSSRGAIVLDRSLYGPQLDLTATVRDLDLNTNPETVEIITVTVSTAGGDLETMVLTETAADTSIFNGMITLEDNAVTTGNGILEISHSETITAVYIDADDGYGGTNVEVTDTARTDCVGPVISGVRVSVVSDWEMTVSWETDEEADTQLFYGEIDPDQTAKVDGLSLHHQLKVNDLNPCTEYVFFVASKDAAGNQTIEDNSGLYFTARTQERFVIMEADMSTEPQWTISGGEWAYGQPTGGGGQHGYPDPTEGHTGLNVIGYNLGGDYPNNMARYMISTQSFDCATSPNVFLSFWRWLGVESSRYDDASIEISVNAEDWSVLWKNPAKELADDQWTYIEYDISEHAAYHDSVVLRWVIGPTDEGWRYCGWNIDDVMIRSIWPCGEPTPTPPPTPTPSPPAGSGMILVLDDTRLTAGDRFHLHCIITNPQPDPLNVDLFIILDVYGQFWCWPSWQPIETGLDGMMNVPLEGYAVETETVLDFTWPQVGGSADGLMFYGLCCRASSFDFVGDLQIVPWSYY
ncbi:hypothetical protein JXA40_02715 [bacterium]|nr:hypothetical protein [candidate division CSSED10-310 bacterium]